MLLLCLRHFLYFYCYSILLCFPRMACYLWAIVWKRQEIIFKLQTSICYKAFTLGIGLYKFIKGVILNGAKFKESLNHPNILDHQELKGSCTWKHKAEFNNRLCFACDYCINYSLELTEIYCSTLPCRNILKEN